MRSLLGDRVRKHDIVFYPSGRIDISAHAARQIGLSPGDVVDIVTERGEYYLYVRIRKPLFGRFEAQVYRDNRRSRRLRTNSQKLRKALLGESGNADVIRLCVGKPVQDDRFGILLPIVTNLHL